jgi:hypothetical protein
MKFIPEKTISNAPIWGGRTSRCSVQWRWQRYHDGSMHGRINQYGPLARLGAALTSSLAYICSLQFGCADLARLAPHEAGRPVEESPNPKPTQDDRKDDEPRTGGFSAARFALPPDSQRLLESGFDKVLRCDGGGEATRRPGIIPIQARLDHPPRGGWFLDSLRHIGTSIQAHAPPASA